MDELKSTTDLDASEPSIVASSLLDREKSDEKVKEKKKKRGKKGKKSKIAVSKIGVVNPFDIPGVTKLPLSAITQKIVGCIVGDDVTAENPWKYVKKEIIEDNIELHEESSEFLPIRQDVSQYPEAELLMGFIAEESDHQDAFYIVHTTDAKETVLQIIEKQQEELQLRLKRSVWRPVGRWQSLGSETEIDANLIQNFRPLYEIELQSKFPIIDTKVSFKLRQVEDARDGYVELLPDVRYPITNVQRKRIDVSVQAAPDRVSNEAQTNPTYPINIWTQYEYECKEPKVTPVVDKNIAQFMNERIDKLADTIKVNEHINIYKDDYATLNNKSRYIVDASEHISTFLSLSDVQTCKGNMVCDCSWDPFMSGIVAVCYNNTPFSTIVHEKNTVDEVAEAVHGCCPVLVWSFTDGLHPKLYLEAPRQVTYLSFSPTQKDILVGGLINGQIIIWDLKHKLEQVESIEVLTSSQKRNRLTIFSMMDWMKNTHNPAVVPPTAISILEHSHKDMITAISWLFRDKEVTKTGKYQDIEDPTTSSEQFISCSVDGTMMVWDIKIKPTVESQQAKPQRKTKRLKKRPSALTIDQSEYKSLSKNLKPHYKLIILDQDKPFPILSIIRKTYYLKYDPIEPEDLDPIVRTRYKLSETQEQSKLYPFLLTSTTGKLICASWEGFDFNAGQLINSEQCSIKHYACVHDGPIVFCNAHPFFQDIILTVGGRIFAVWMIGEDNPLLWRKAQNCKYMSGGWTTEHPSYVALVRSDGSLELWDLLLSSTKPSKYFPMGGDMIMNILGTLTSPHCRKSTFAVSDNLGTLTILHLPGILLMHQEEQRMCKIIFERARRRRHQLKNWIAQMQEKYKQEHVSVKKETDELIPPPKKHVEKEDTKVIPVKKISEIEKMERIFTGIHWNSLQEKVMYDTMLKKKKLNLAELELQKKPLQKIAAEKRERLEKQEKALANREKIFESARLNLFQKIKSSRQRQYSIYDTDDDFSSHLEQYDEIEKRALNYIQCNEFELSFEWSKVLEQGKERRRKIETVLQYVNVHNRYNIRKLIKKRLEDLGSIATSQMERSPINSMAKENVSSEVLSET